MKEKKGPDSITLTYDLLKEIPVRADAPIGPLYASFARYAYWPDIRPVRGTGTTVKMLSIKPYKNRIVTKRLLQTRRPGNIYFWRNKK